MTACADRFLKAVMSLALLFVEVVDVDVGMTGFASFLRPKEIMSVG
jgi:hypothetical protein